MAQLSLHNFLVLAKTMILGKQHNKQGNGPFPYPVLSLIIALSFFAWLTLVFLILFGQLFLFFENNFSGNCDSEVLYRSFEATITCSPRFHG
jgi:hypothetical protein